ncbi:glycosyltransferase, partial [Kineococcus glutinatus]|uniref:glycosyltransferase n=1 Tax=Kineococcus glutinatus TaxID=1070872 RepID=UPI003CD07D1E
MPEPAPEPARPDTSTTPGPSPAGTAAGGRCAVVIPAKDEAERIAATARAAARIPGVDLVVVVDDGSRDTTAPAARAAA